MQDDVISYDVHSMINGHVYNIDIHSLEFDFLKLYYSKWIEIN